MSAFVWGRERVRESMCVYVGVKRTLTPCVAPTPMPTPLQVMTPITLVSLHNHTAPGTAEDAVRGGAAGPRRRHGLHLVFPAFDGHLYIVDGADGCTNKVDVGEHR